jgi:Fe-S-cluster containining protein
VQHVYPAPPDISAIAAFLEMSPVAFLATHCDTDAEGTPHLKGLSGDCRFLEEKSCRIHPVRPAQCQAWPFWIENLNPETWNNEVMTVCPGAGKGRLWRAEEIDQIAARRDEREGFRLSALPGFDE